MDLKILLRYQISGSIFIGWFLLFHYSVHSADLPDMATKIMDISSLASLIIAMPIGAIIHQLSVTIKNQIFGATCIPILSDSPMKNPTRTILRGFRNSNGGEYVKYIDEKISKLNSFYYVRFDNGFLAPLLAYVLFTLADGNLISNNIELLFILLMSCLSIFVISYQYNIIKEFAYISLTLSIIVLIVVMFTPLTTAHHSNIELTTKLIKVEANARYVITKDYSFDTPEGMESAYTKYIRYNLILNRNSALKESYLIESNLQKISILESANINNKQTISCTAKCAKCSHELSCTISNTPENKEESQLHISKAEITKIDTTLLNKILITCLIISFLLLSYIPRIIQELKEYTDELKKIKPSVRND